ncbi:hypothetical protein B4U79_05856 [Dinothrombium tinctorium]|uniref:Uncharacterized protein n=1 Tax=Dinothrombium tinctorium TaxID=1965070 RepID=A0A443Q872_9ACAR|nr:hypothetical protein B4U79_05856 [Dinothrombium tinctorium]
MFKKKSSKTANNSFIMHEHLWL